MNNVCWYQRKRAKNKTTK